VDEAWVAVFFGEVWEGGGEDVVVAVDFSSRSEVWFSHLFSKFLRVIIERLAIFIILRQRKKKFL